MRSVRLRISRQPRKGSASKAPASEDDPARHEKTPAIERFSKRLMGFEPTTFCMAMGGGNIHRARSRMPLAVARLAPEIASECEIVRQGRATPRPDRDDPPVALERHPVGPSDADEANRRRSSACRRRRSSGRASRSGCSGPARSVASAADHDDPAVGATASPFPAPIEVGRLLAVSGETGVEGAVGVVAGRATAPPLGAVPPSATILPFWSATPLAPSLPAEVGGLLSIAGETRVQRSVGVVADDREVAAEEPPLPTATILPSPCSATPVAPTSYTRSRWSACHRRRNSCPAIRSGCSGQLQSRSRWSRRRRPRRSCRSA